MKGVKKQERLVLFNLPSVSCQKRVFQLSGAVRAKTESLSCFQIFLKKIYP